MEDQRARVMRELIEPERLRDTSAKFVEVVRGSFVEDRARIVTSVFAIKTGPTQDEIRRRTNMVYDLFTRMRGDMKYSMIKTMDMLQEALRCELDGEIWEPPPAERGWGVKAGSA